MDWMVLLPIFVSIGTTGAVAYLIYFKPPRWTSQEITALKNELREAKDELKALASPTNLGDAIHHAASKNDYELMNVAADYGDDLVAKAIPVFTERLANEAVGLVASMYSKGVASEMGKSSGAARGYLKLPGIQKAALKTGAESLLGGGLGELLGGLDIPPELIQGFMANMLQGGGNNGAQQPQQSHQTAGPVWRPPV